MRCPGAEALARAAADADVGAATHAASCGLCRAIIDELRGSALAIATLSAPTLTSERRAALGDVVLVSAQHMRPPVDRRLGIAVAAGVALAACVAIVVITREPPARVAIAPPVATSSASRISVSPIAPQTSVQALGGTTYEFERTGDHDTVHVHGGDGIAIESAAPIDVDLGATTIALAPGRFEIHALRGAIESVRVYAGSAQIHTETYERTLISGETWTPPVAVASRASAIPTAAPVVVPEVTGKEWFRIGWVALREHRDIEAIAAFDHATDPSIAEDAAFWAAFAAERAGDPSALDRFERFVAAFPRSDRRSVAAEHVARLHD